jgi:YaiO family outer membrane protein
MTARPTHKAALASFSIFFTLFERSSMLKTSLLFPLCILACTAPAFAQSLPSSQDGAVAAAPLQASAEPIRNLELSTGAQSLTGGYGNWNDITLRGAYGMSRHVFQAEASVQRRFNEDGAFIGLGDTYTFNEDWYGSLAVGAGDGAFYLPRYRADATLYRKFLPGRNLVGNVGIGYYKAPDGHSDRSVSVGAAYYFEAPWIIEGGVRFNSSNPGSVRTQQQFAAVTYGRDKQDLVTARYAWGGEGYLATGPNTQLVNFDSREASIAWRHWFSPRTGVLVGANRYSNPLYRRTGVNVGIFHSF